MSAEVIEWFTAKHSLPDDEETVLVKVRDADPDVWLGYHCDDEWLYVEGGEIEGEVLLWARMPTGEM